MNEVPRIVGRRDELAALRRLLDALPHSGSSALLTGSAGIGKTTLIDDLSDRARSSGIDVVALTATEAEAALPFAALHQLLFPYRDALAALPSPQEAALRQVFGETDDDAPSVYLVALGALTLLSDIASTSGLLVTIDDAQWLDPGTRQVVSFVARRLRSESIMLLVAERREDEADGLGAEIRVPLRPLDDADARSVIDSAAPGLAPRERRDVLVAASGNPLALTELAARPQLASPEADVLPLSDRMTAAFAARVRHLDGSAKGLLLVAALSAEGRTDEVLEASSRLTGEHDLSDALESVVAAGLLNDDSTTLRFRHPLVRTAVISSATPGRRSRAHLAIAAALRPGSDRRTWHLANASSGPDEHLAAALEEGAERALRAGDSATAILSLRHAAELSVDRRARVRRSTRAAEIALDAGQIDLASSISESLDPDEADEAVRARLAWVKHLLPGAGREGDVETALGIIDGMHRAGDTARAIDTLLTTAFHLWGSTPTGHPWRRFIEQASRYGVEDGDPRMLFLLAWGAPEQHAENVRRAALAIEPRDLPTTESRRLLGLALSACGMQADAERILTGVADELRSTGNLSVLAVTLTSLITNRFVIGDLRGALTAAMEAIQVAEETGETFIALTAAVLQGVADGAVSGRFSVDDLARRFPSAAFALPHNPFLVQTLIAEGVTLAAAGRYSEADERLSRVTDPADPAFHRSWAMLALPFAVLAAVRSGRSSDAAAVVSRMRDEGTLVDGDLLRWGLAFADSILADDADVERHLTVLAGEGQHASPLLAALAVLDHGERLLRLGQVEPATVRLQEARSSLDGLGARIWAEQPRRLLHSLGLRAPRPRPDRGQALTGQEQRIAGLAAGGLTNRQIAEHLFLSPKTVAAHLHAVFRKLGISSRTELGALEGTLFTGG